MPQSSQLNPVVIRPQAPALSEALWQLCSSGVGAVISSHHETCPPGRGHKERVNRASSIEHRVSRMGLPTRRCDGSFHRPDCSINGPAESTKKLRQDEQDVQDYPDLSCNPVQENSGGQG